MQVYRVNQSDIINAYANDVILYNAEMRVYFQTLSSVTLPEDTTFRDAVLGAYKTVARTMKIEYTPDYIMYDDTRDDEKLLTAFNQIDTIRSLVETKIQNVAVINAADTLPTADKASITNNLSGINLSGFSKIIYVAVDGNDTNNGGSIGTAVRSVRRAEELAVENTAIVFGPGKYDITRGNVNSNPRYCISGLSGKLINGAQVKIHYINAGNLGDVTLIADTTTFEYEARDVTLANGLTNPNTSIIRMQFKLLDNARKTSYGVSIARGCEGISFIDCAFDITSLNGNIAYNSLVGKDPIHFENCIVDFKKKLNGLLYDIPYAGQYTLNKCKINESFRTKIESFDSLDKDMRGNKSLILNTNTTFFTKA